MSQHIRPEKPAAGGFTLIELLIVIVIIGILVALLAPAVMGVRERARQTTCLNNQKTVTMAILGYDASSGHFPGFVNQVTVSGGTVGVNWCEVILPGMDRNDLWTNGLQSGGTFSPVKVGEFICPDDGNAAAPGVQAPLTYIVNSNICDNRVLQGSVVDVTVSQLKGASRTLLLGEGPMTNTATVTAAGPWNANPSPPYNPPYNPLSYSIYASPTWLPTNTPPNLTFTWNPLPAGPWQHLSALAQLFPTPPYHPGVYVAAYCDGSVKILSVDADCTTISTRVDGAIP